MTALALSPAARWPTSPADRSTRSVAAMALVIAAVAHAVAVVDHRDSLAAAPFFVGAALLQLASAFAYLRTPSYRLRVLITGTTSLLLGLWAASRTVGVPIGHSHGPEALAILDGVAVAAEVVALVTVTAASRLARWRQRSLAVALSMAIAGTAWFAASGPPVDHQAADHSSTAPAYRAHHGPPPGDVEDPAAIPAQGVSMATTVVDPPGAMYEDKACHDSGCEPHAHP